MRVRPIHLLCAASLLASLGAGMRPAAAQMESREAISLQNQILQLRNQMQGLQGQVGSAAPTQLAAPAPASGGGASAPVSNELTAQLLDRVSRLEDETRLLRGRVDELTNQLQQQNADLTKQIGDLSFAVQGNSGQQGSLGQQGNPGAAAGGALAGAPTALAPRASGGGTAGLPTGTLGTLPAAGNLVPAHRPPEVALQQGNAALARRDYPAAEAAAREVLAEGHGVRSIDAQFLLAQSLAGQRNFQAAAIAYDDAYNRSHTGRYAPDALLGLANSLTAINQKPAACASLDKLRVEFPTLRAELRPAVVAARQRAACH